MVANRFNKNNPFLKTIVIYYYLLLRHREQYNVNHAMKKKYRKSAIPHIERLILCINVSITCSII